MRVSIRSLWNNEFIKGGAIFTLSGFVGNIINYFFNFLAARALGPIGFGEITALFSYMTLFAVPTLVMTLVVIQKIGSKGRESRQFALLLRDWFKTQVKKWWFFLIPLVVIIPFIPRVTNLSTISSSAFIPLALLGFISSFYGAIFQGLKFFGWFSLIGLTAVLLKLMGPVLVFAGIDGLATIMIFLILSPFVSFLLYRFSMNKYIKKENVQKKEILQRRLRDALINKQVIITFLSMLALTMLNNVDIIFVKKFFNPTATGVYSSWSLFAKIIFYIVGPAVTVSFIFFSQKQSKKSEEKILLVSLGVLFFIGLCSFLAYKNLSFLLIQIFFGEKFLPVAPYLSQASIFGSLYTVTAFMNSYFLAKKSYLSLLLPILIPVYAAILFFIPRTLSNIIMLNILFTSFLTGFYLVASSWRFIYNRLRWK